MVANPITGRGLKLAGYKHEKGEEILLFSLLILSAFAVLLNAAPYASHPGIVAEFPARRSA